VQQNEQYGLATAFLAPQPAAVARFVIGPWLRTFGWLATGVMGLTAIGMFATWGSKPHRMP
jgi:hypothetical protein